MSREILFRGKERSGVLNHQWIYGALDNTDEENPNIIYLDRFGNKCIVGVSPETVGQYTGLTDNNRKNKKKIFEGDIVKAYFNFNPADFVIGKVIFEYGTFKIRVTGTKKNGEFSKYTDDNIKAYAIENNFINRGYLLEVIGNIHDNPELLKCD